MTCLLGEFITTASRLARYTLHLLAMASTPIKPVYDALGIFVTVTAPNYTCVPFMLPWHTLGFYGFVAILSGLVFFYSPVRAAVVTVKEKEKVEKPKVDSNENALAPVNPGAHAGVVLPSDSVARE